MSIHPDNLIWIDLEMTGLDPENDVIIEMATIVTDSQLNVLAEGPVIAIHQSDEILAGIFACDAQQEEEQEQQEQEPRLPTWVPARERERLGLRPALLHGSAATDHRLRRPQNTHGGDAARASEA